MFDWLKKLGSAGAPPRTSFSLGVPAAHSAAQRSEAKRIEGNTLLDSGRISEAAIAYAQAVALDAGSVGARVNLAYCFMEQERNDDAEFHLGQVLAIDASNFDGTFMLGNIAKMRGALDDAMRYYKKALELNPDVELTHIEACKALVAVDEYEEAETVARNGITAHPRSADLHFLLGNFHLRARRTESAVNSYEKALSIHANHADAHSNMALALRIDGKLEAAVASYRRAIVIRPRAVEAHYNLALTLCDLGQSSGAIEEFQRVVALQPDHFDAHLNLGVALQSLAQFDSAIRSYRLALALKPNSAQAHCNLGLALAETGRPDEALRQYQRALECDPEHARSHSALAVYRNQIGQPTEALASFRQALSRDPNDIEARSSMLFLLSFVAAPSQYLAEARRYGDAVAALAQPLIKPASGGMTQMPGRLRVGFVSGDLRMHPVALFLESVLANLNPTRVEVFAYATTALEDEVTQRLKADCAGWVSIVGMSDEFAARRIHADGIHVLIDLAGHTAHNRLSLFAWKPAPVQVSWLGYFASTGVAAIDYLLADRGSVPEHLQSQFTEAVWYLPHTRLCYTVPMAQPHLDVAPLPAVRNGHVTFGSFQTIGKLNDEVLLAWAQILGAVPESRLRIQAKQLDRPEIRNKLLERLTHAGIAAERVSLVPPAARELYLVAHNQVDIILDTFPYPGGTTTCEALWMGVPTLTLTGETLLSRQGVSMLTCVGLDDWVATDMADYVARAVRYACDLESLAQTRAGLRKQALASPLFDAPRFALDLEAAFRGMWQEVAGRMQPCSS